MRRWNGSTIAVGLLMIGLLLALPRTGQAGAGAGLRVGYANADDEVFKGGGELDATNMVGLQLRLDLVPSLSIEAAGEFISQELGAREGIIGGYEAATEGDYEDLTFFATLKLKVITLPLFPLHGYVGGGFNVHWIDFKAKDYVYAGAGEEPEGFEGAIKKYTGERSEVGWHLVAGVALRPAKAPLSGFLEARYLDSSETDAAIASKALYAGLSIEF